MNAIKIFAISVVWFLLLYAVFSFCYFNLDASAWETSDRVFMSFLWFALSFASATHFTGVGK